MKLLLYCTKSNPYLYKLYGKNWFYFGEKLTDLDVKLNGKIVAQCDCNKIDGVCCSPSLENFGEFLWGYCLFAWQLYDYLDGKLGYNIHLSNVEVFDVPKDLSDFGVKKAPQNMMKCFGKGNEYILISIRPEHLKNILNGKKTIEVRKKILKCLEGLMK